jgi:hypothetical protein
MCCHSALTIRRVSWNIRSQSKNLLVVRCPHWMGQAVLQLWNLHTKCLFRAEFWKWKVRISLLPSSEYGLFCKPHKTVDQTPMIPKILKNEWNSEQREESILSEKKKLTLKQIKQSYLTKMLKLVHSTIQYPKAFYNHGIQSSSTWNSLSSFQCGFVACRDRAIRLCSRTNSWCITPNVGCSLTRKSPDAKGNRSVYKM